MNCDNSASCVGLVSKDAKPTHDRAVVPKTVDQVFADQIEQARKAVETLCIKRAKLEAAGLSNHPYEELTSLLNTYPF